MNKKNKMKMKIINKMEIINKKKNKKIIKS